MNHDNHTQSTFALNFNFGALLPKDETDTGRAQAAIMEHIIQLYGLASMQACHYMHGSNGMSVITRPRSNSESAKISFISNYSVLIEANNRALAVGILDGIHTTILVYTGVLPF